MKQKKLPYNFVWNLEEPDEDNATFLEYVGNMKRTRDEKLIAYGNEIYRDEEILIVRVVESAYDLQCFILFGVELLNNVDIDGLEDDVELDAKYLCLDPWDHFSLFWYDEESLSLCYVETDEIGNFVEYDGVSGICPIGDMPIIGRGDGKPVLYDTVRISLPMEDIEKLEQDDVLVERGDYCEESGKEEIPRSVPCKMNRSLSWLSTCDCGILTTWRKDHNRATKNRNNQELQRRLRELGYGVSRLKGWYPENDEEVVSENSFLVFDKGKTGQAFYETLFELSERYNQDSFLYKKAGRYEPAYLVYTNGLHQKGSRQCVGRLKINDMSAEVYSEIGSGRIAFR